MNLKIHFWLSGVALASVLLLAACGGSSTGGATAADLKVSSPGEQLAFAPSTLAATAGAQVTVTYTNGSTAQKHTWVLVRGGDDIATKVNDAAAANGGAVSPGSDVIAGTKLVAGGGSETLSFTAPAAGSYTYLCTVPGHYPAGMKGALIVK